MANFVLKFSPFRCHDNQGRSGVNFNDTGKLLDLENPLFGPTFVALFLVLAEFWPFFPLKFQIFVVMATGVESDVNSNDTSKLLDFENPLFGATFVALFLVLGEF